MKFIDLHDEIEDNLGSTRAPIERILEYLDDHPELTGRDRMESELKAISDRTQVSPWAVRAVTTALGHGVIPDPKPTNFERLEAFLEGGDINAQWGLRGGGVMFATELARALDEAGVKAPGDAGE